MSKSVWVKPAVRVTAPRRLIAVAVASRHLPASRSDRHFDVWSKGYTMTAAYRRGSWSVGDMIEWDHGREMLDWIDRQGGERSSTYVVCPIASHVLTQSGAWSRWEERGVAWSGPGGAATEVATTAGAGHRSAEAPRTRSSPVAGAGDTAGDTISVSAMIMRGKPDILRYRTGDRSYTWVSGAQYLTGTEDSLAAAIGYLWPRSGGPVPVGTVRAPDGGDRCELWLRLMMSLSDWWRSIGGGPWSATIGGLANSYFRRRLSAKTVLAHQEHPAREIEERALFGGRASTWYYGTVGDPRAAGPDGSPGPAESPWGSIDDSLDMWDVRSMYPTILRTEIFPVRLMGVRDDPSVGRLSAELREWCIIAAVRVRARTSECPYRVGDRVTYPTGEYDTVLAGPELRAAIDAGEVLRCYRAASYMPGRPWAGAAAELVNLRSSYRDSKQDAWADLTKMLANSFSGKLAQRKYNWERRPNVQPALTWGEWSELSHHTGEVRRFRTAVGLVWERVSVPHQGRPLASCYAYLTAYGRRLMADARALAGSGTVVSQDTDGLWTLRSHRQSLIAARDSLGRRGYDLQLKHADLGGRWFGPRHYWTTRGWVLAGFHDPRRWGDGHSFTNSYTIIPPVGTGRAPPVGVLKVCQVQQLGSIPVDGRISDSGWTVPSCVL